MKSRIKTVFLFGAGASATAGAPVMNTFFDAAKRIRRIYADDPRIQSAINHFDKVFDFINHISGIFSKSFIDLNNIENVFGAIEMFKLLDLPFPHDKDYDVDKMKESLIIVIVKTIEFSMPFPVHESEVYPPPDYKRFIEMINLFLKDNKFKDFYDFTFITFNYDLGLEVALKHIGIKYKYYLDDEEGKLGIPLLKLHGSINWAKNKESHAVFGHNFNRKLNTFRDSLSDFKLAIGSEIIENEHYSSTPILVPPTFNKSQYHEIISRVWKKAAQELSDAENIFIIGYSLPDTDMFFRFLYSLGMLGSKEINRVYIINPDVEVATRFKQFMGHGISAGRFEQIPGNFNSSVDIILKILKSQTNSDR